MCDIKTSWNNNTKKPNQGPYIGDEWKDFPNHKYKGIEGDKLLDFEPNQLPKYKHQGNFSLNTSNPVPPKKDPNQQTDPFWLERPKILFDRDKLTEFYPDSQLTIDEQLNAITRFIIYFGFLLFVISGNLSSLFLILVGMAMVIFIQQHGRHFLAEKKEHFLGTYRKEYNLPDNYPIRIDHRGEVKQAPTRENPFMNVSNADYTKNPARPPAANLQDPGVQDEIRKIFNDNLFLDIDDIWEKRNGQREFVTQPSTQIPNDRETWAKWCFDTRNHSCRENYICKNDVRFDQTGPLPSQIFKNM